MAVRTGDTSLSVDTHTPEFIVWVLCFEDRRTRELVGVVGVVHLIVVGLNIFDGEALIVWEGEVFAFTLEVILRMALCTNERTHMLMRLLRHILTSASEGFKESRACRLEVHRTCIVAVRATDRIDDLTPPLAPGSLVELSDTLFLHHTGDIGALAGPAGPGLYILLAIDTRGACTKDLTHVFDGVLVPTWCVILHCERVACPQDDHLRSCCEYVDTL